MELLGLLMESLLPLSAAHPSLPEPSPGGEPAGGSERESGSVGLAASGSLLAIVPQVSRMACGGKDLPC
jgi:hypothetical protein